MANEIGDVARKISEGLAYVCQHLDQIRADLSYCDGSGDLGPLERLLAAVSESREIAGPLNALHDALLAGGDALGVYGHARDSGPRGLRPAGVDERPVETVYLCPNGGCSRYGWPDATNGTPQCEISGKRLRRERL